MGVGRDLASEWEYVCFYSSPITNAIHPCMYVLLTDVLDSHTGTHVTNSVL